METWYRLNMISFGSRPRIEAVEVERETDKFVIISGRRRSKSDGYESYHRTWADARYELISRRTRAYEAALEALNHAQSVLAEAEALTEPTP